MGLQRNEQELPIGDYLYNQFIVREGKQRSMREEYYSNVAPGYPSPVSRNSEQIVELLKETRAKELFALMDSDEDGKISAPDNVCISTLPTEVLEILAPLLCEMESMQMELDLGSFIQAMNQLFQSLSVSDKHKLLKDWTKRRSAEPSSLEMTFRPEVNQKSVQMLRDKEKYKTPADRYNKLFMDASKKSQVHFPLNPSHGHSFGHHSFKGRVLSL